MKLKTPKKVAFWDSCCLHGNSPSKANTADLCLSSKAEALRWITQAPMMSTGGHRLESGFQLFLSRNYIYLIIF